MGLISELRRRNVLRMAVLYAVAAWLIVQVAGVLIDLAKLPDWIGTTILWLLAIGFPIALIFSWFYEITPEGVSLEKDVDPEVSITHVTGRRLDFIVISLLCAAVIMFAYDKWWTQGPTEASIVVLPFVNMSDGETDEYFSDGISEELLNLLARVPKLRVISRNSAFGFKDQGLENYEIAKRLGVAHILDGSVRKSGNEVRITVRLIDARSSAILWSNAYDRPMENIFTIQGEIATHVVEQLRVALLGGAPEIKYVSPEIYALQLQALHLRNQFTPESLEKAIALYMQVLADDPTNAAAWDGLAVVYSNQSARGLRSFEEGYRLAREATNNALNSDPDYARAHGSLGWIAMFHDGDLKSAARHFERALILDPTDLQTLAAAATLAKNLGNVEDAIAVLEYVSLRDPVNAATITNLATGYLYARRWDDAIRAYRTTLELSPEKGGTHTFTGFALLLKGQGEAALKETQQERLEVWRMIGVPMIYHSLGDVTESEASLAELISKYEHDAPYNIAYVFAFRGDSDSAFIWLEKAVQQNDPGLSEIPRNPLFANIHSDPRWLPFLESIGKSPEQLAAIEFDMTLPE